VTQLNCLTSKTPVWCKIRGSVCYIGRVMVNFLLQFWYFRYHGNRGRSEVNFNETIKLLDLEKPLFGATFVALSLVLAEFQPIFCQIFQIFVIMATGVGVRKISTTPLNCPTPKIPTLVQTSCFYL